MKKILITLIAGVLISFSGWSQCTIGGFVSPTCVTGSVQTGTITGGTLVGPGVTGNDFDPAVAGVGIHELYIIDPVYAPDLYYIDQTGTYAPVAGSGTGVFLSDDQTSGAFPIGFTFSFFGNNYTDFYISSNGFLGFSAGMSQGCCSGGFLPTSGNPDNLIAFSWDDMYPPGNGTIEYFTTGSAPNQMLVMNFYDIPFCCGSTPAVKTQVILYETTNIIEIHTEYANGVNPGTMGIENIDGTIGYAVPGRNSAAWPALVNDYVAFIPTICAQTTIEVTAAVVADLGLDFELCPGESAWVSPGLGMASYLWNDASTSDSLEITGPGQYFVDIVDGGGCADDDTINVTVATIAIVTPATSYCIADPLVTLEANPSSNPSPNDNTPGIWSGPGVSSGGVNVDTIPIFDFPGSGVEDSITFGTDLCVEGITVIQNMTSSVFTLPSLASIIDSISFTVYHTSCDVAYDWNIYVNGVLIETITGLNPNTCSCIPAIEFEVITSSDPGLQANWNPGGTNTIAIEYTNFSSNIAGAFAQVYSQANIFDPMAAGPGTHTITYDVCTLSETVNFTVMDTVQINPLNSFAICNGNSVSLTSNIPTGLGYSSWSNGETTDTITVTTPGWYMLTNTYCNTTDFYEVLYSPDFVITSIVTDPVTGNDGAIDITVFGGTPGFTFDWDNGETTEDITGLGDGIYTVIVIDANGCTDTLTVIVGIVGLNNVDPDFGISLFPNPNKGQFDMTINSSSDYSNVNVNIINAAGQAVYAEIINVVNGSNNYNFDIANLESGIYFVNIYLNDKVYITKLSVE